MIKRMTKAMDTIRYKGERGKEGLLQLSPIASDNASDISARPDTG